jgi:ABC-type glycerol-3-phosphate transport system permease component
VITTKSRTERFDTSSFLVYLLLGLLALVFLFPFYWMMISATMSLPELGQFPPRLVPGGHLIENWNTLTGMLPLVRAFFNSLFISITTTLLQLFFCSLAGYAFAKYNFPGREKLFIALLATMMIPSAVGLIPWYVMMSKFHWVDQYQALIVPSMVSAFGVFWMRQFITASVPDELLQAARIDGCGDFGIYWRIVAPIILPGLGALGIITFMGAWNDYLGPLVIIRTLNNYTLPLVIGAMSSNLGTRIHLQLLGAAFATVPVLLVFFFASQRFIAGLTAGALKG